jgi:hypothetical protein
MPLLEPTIANRLRIERKWLSSEKLLSATVNAQHRFVDLNLSTTSCRIDLRQLRRSSL